MRPHLDHYVLSDLHLDHKNILSYCRPWFADIEAHDKYIIDCINNVCNKNDVLWLLGDIAFTKSGLAKLANLECKNLMLIGGNHDNFRVEEYLKYFKQLHAVAQIYIPGFESILLSHIPMHPDQRWDINIHGHMHTYHVDNDRYINVSCEPMNFTPKRICDLIKEKKDESIIID